jgi:hypothetical protein
MSPLGKPSVVKKSGSGPATSNRTPISMKPSDAESGGLLDDVNATITKAEATTWDYNGQADPGPALKITLKADDGGEAEQYYSAGKMERVVPSEDGTCFYPAEGASSKGLNNNCNAMTFLLSCTDQGFPEEKMENFTSLVGLYAHFNRVPQKERAGLDDPNKKKTILVVTKIISMPWEKKGRVAAKTSPAETSSVVTTTAATVNGSAVLNNEAIAAVVAALIKANGPIEVTRLGLAAYQAGDPKSPNRKHLIKHVLTSEFLGQDGLPFTVTADGEYVMMVEG